MIARSVIAVLAVLVPSGVSAVTLDSNAHKRPEIVASGQTLYQAHCASCHGVQLQGQPDWRLLDDEGYLPAPPHDETGHTWHHPTAQLFEITKYGTEAVVGGGYKSRMIGFGDVLRDDEILSILAYIKSTWPRRVLDHHERLDAAYGNR